MVAEFRQAKPHIVYVNLNSSNNTIGEAQASASAEDTSQPLRGIVRENIIRRGDNLLNNLLEADSELRPVIMGTSNPNGLEHSPYSQMAHHSDENYGEDRENVGGHFGAQSSLAAYRSNADSTRLGGGSHSSANNYTSDSRINSQSNASSSHSDVPLIRLADFSSVSSFGFNDRTSPQNSFLQSSTVADPSSGSNSAFNNYAGVPAPSVRIFHSTSTYEIHTAPTSSSYNLDNGANRNHAHSVAAHVHAHGVGHNNGLGAHASHSHNMGAGYLSDRDGSRHGGRRAGGSIGPVRPRHSTADVLCVDPQCMATKFLLNQESILKENEALKRKLQMLADTIRDEEKLKKVLRCLADRKRAASTCR